MPPDLFPSTHTNGLRDNYCRGSVGDFLRDHIDPGSESRFGLYPLQPPTSEVPDTDAPGLETHYLAMKP